jgi:hypothetical protein
MVTEEQGDLIEKFMKVFPRAYTVEDTMRLCLRLKDQCEDLQAELEECQRQYKALKYGEGSSE